MSQKTHDDDNDREEDHARKEKPDPAVSGLTAAPSGDHPRASHTPGPWREGPTEGIGQRGKLIVVDANGLKVADCEADRLDGGLKFRRPLVEDTANAHLIAAAPDLYEAMKGAMQWLDQTVGPCDEGCECFLHDFHAALAKAEGRS